MVRPTLEKWGPWSDLFVDHDRALKLFAIMGATRTYNDEPSEGARVYFERAETLFAALAKPDDEVIARLEDVSPEEAADVRSLLENLRQTWTRKALAPFIDEDGALTLLVDW